MLVNVNIGLAEEKQLTNENRFVMTNTRLLTGKVSDIASEKKKNLHTCEKTLVAIFKTSSFNCHILFMVV